MGNPRLFDRAVLRLSPLEPGEDVRGFLQGLVTQDSALVQTGAPQYAALLSAQGKLLFDFILWADGDDLLIDAEAASIAALAKRLTLYRLRRKIGIAPDPGLGVFWSADGTAHGVADPRLPALGQRWIAPIGEDDVDVSDDWRKHRLMLGVTEGTDELGQDALLWLECNAAELNGVSFTKGCYVGQENTARMNWRQKVNRRLLVVPLDQSDPKRQRIAYPDLGLAVDHPRIDALDGVTVPDWWPDVTVQGE